MTNRTIYKIFFISLGLLFLLLGFYGNKQLKLRLREPFKWKNWNNQVVISDTLSQTMKQSSSLIKGDILIKVEDKTIIKGQELEFLFDSGSFDLDQPVSFKVRRGTNELIVSDFLVPRYRNMYILLNLFLGLFFWVIGIFVFLKKQTEKATRVFFWAAMILTVIIMTIYPHYPPSTNGIEYLFSVFFFALFLLVPALILYFALLYPQRKQVIRRHKIIPFFLFTPSLVFIVLIEISYYYTIQLLSLEYFRSFHVIYNWFRGYYILYLMMSIGSMIHSYVQATTKEEKNKIQWILWGLCIGAFPFLFLWTIPEVLGFSPLIPQEFNYIFLIFVPLAFSFSIIKYQIMDIEIVINRSIVYSILTVIIVGLYLLVVGIAGQFLHNLGQPSNTMIIIFTLVAAIIFSPIKQQVQILVDKTFYRIKYDYRLAIKDFNRSLTATTSLEELIQLFVQKINQAIPIKKMAVVLRDNSTNNYTVQESYGISKEEIKNLSFNSTTELIQTICKLKEPMIKRGRAEFSENAFLPDHLSIKLKDIELLVPKVYQNEVIGFLLVGQKKSEIRFFEEDLQLITQMMDMAVRAFERIKLQEEMILERTKKEKLEELNQLKSEFISHVSHELRTPLTSICWSVENMLDGIPEKPSEKITAYLEGINDCSLHLRRMIENLLDISRIEAGKIEILPEKLDLTDEIQRCLEIAKPLANDKKIGFETKLDTNLIVNADRDCLQEVLNNLVNNALKYSPQESVIKIEVKKGKDNHKIISVFDQGPGIPKNQQAAIFEKFQRIRTEKSIREKGLGLGLYIVKKLVELQGGQIWVESEEGKGSVFSFSLPV
jgi:signal transduction histidine kinase